MSNDPPLPLPAELGERESAPCFAGGAYRANLYVYNGRGEIRWFALTPDHLGEGRFFTMGRTPDCNILITDTSVSGRHAYIHASDDELVLRDLESTNGTQVNEEWVSEVALRHGDVIRIGVTDIRFLCSYREPPVHLVVDFLEGPNQGKRLNTYGASTTIGRLNCMINLQGAAVAAQHVRLDAFGPELVYVANLKPDNMTWINGERVRGIVAGRAGDVIRVGDHRIQISVVGADEPAAAVEQGDGTLQAPVGGTPSPRGNLFERADPNRPFMEVDSDARAQLAAEAQALLADPERSGRASASAQAPLPPGQAAEGDRHLVPARRGHRGTRRLAIVLGMLLGLVGATLIGLQQIEVPRSLAIRGKLAPAHLAPVTASVEGRVERLYVKVGDQVVGGDLVALIVDTRIIRRIKQLDEQIQRLETEVATPRFVTIVRSASPEARAALEAAEAAVRRSEELAGTQLAAYNRMEISHQALQAAQAQATEARRALARAKATVAGAGTTRKRLVADEEGLLEALEKKLSAKAALESKVRVEVRAPSGGLVLADGPLPKEGQAVGATTPLFSVGGVDTLEARLAVPPALLGQVTEGTSSQLTPEGFPNVRIDVELGEPAAAPSPDGTYPLLITLDNRDHHLRAGQGVTAQIELPPRTGLEWLWQRVR